MLVHKDSFELGVFKVSRKLFSLKSHVTVGSIAIADGDSSSPQNPLSS